MSISSVYVGQLYPGVGLEEHFDFQKYSLHRSIQQARENLCSLGFSFSTEVEESSNWKTLKKVVLKLFAAKGGTAFHIALITECGEKFGFLVVGLALGKLEEKGLALCSLRRAEAARCLELTCRVANECFLLSLAGDFSEDLCIQTQFILNVCDVQSQLIYVLSQHRIETSTASLREDFDLDMLKFLLSLTRVKSLLRLEEDACFLGRRGAEIVLRRFLMLARSNYRDWLGEVYGTTLHSKFGKDTHNLLALSLLSLGWTAVDLLGKAPFTIYELSGANVCDALIAHFVPLGINESEAKSEVALQSVLVSPSAQEAMLRTSDAVLSLFYHSVKEHS